MDSDLNTKDEKAVRELGRFHAGIAPPPGIKLSPEAVILALEHYESIWNAKSIPETSVYGYIGSCLYRLLPEPDQIVCRQAMAVVVRSIQLRGPNSNQLLPRVCPSCKLSHFHTISHHSCLEKCPTNLRLTSLSLFTPPSPALSLGLALNGWSLCSSLPSYFGSSMPSLHAQQRLSSEAPLGFALRASLWYEKRRTLQFRVAVAANDGLLCWSTHLGLNFSLIILPNTY